MRKLGEFFSSDASQWRLLVAAIATAGVTIVLILGMIAYFVFRKCFTKKNKDLISTITCTRESRIKARSQCSYCGLYPQSKTLDYYTMSPRSLYSTTTTVSVNAFESTDIESRVFTYREMVIATDNFNPENAIGSGAFGVVYRGFIDGRAVAVKAVGRGEKGEHEFRVEVDMLNRLHSPYLLELIGYSADQEHRLLVFEYMARGNLQDHLYADGSAGRPPMLDWNIRMKIALDAARALEYLHERISPPVIHRDFKTSNILLDDYFNVKVSDFGLAKLGSEKAGGHVSTEVLGTKGYVAPEYVLTGHLTTKSDVYSYGIVLLELITGRSPVDMTRPTGERILSQWALPKLTDRSQLSELVDPRLNNQYSMNDMAQVCAIAAQCIQSEADYRPYMADVVQSLLPFCKAYRTSRDIMKSPSHVHHTVSTGSSSSEVGPALNWR